MAKTSRQIRTEDVTHVAGVDALAPANDNDARLLAFFGGLGRMTADSYLAGKLVLPRGLVCTACGKKGVLQPGQEFEGSDWPKCCGIEMDSVPDKRRPPRR